MAELLLELLSEEIPARMQARAGRGLEAPGRRAPRGRRARFSTAPGPIVTPRRLTLVVEGLPTRQPDVREERKGPRVSAPEKALQGFLRANGLDSVEQAEVRDDPKGRVLRGGARDPWPGQTEAVLPELLSQAVRALSWPKSMRWPGSAQRWVRPLRAVLGALRWPGVERRATARGLERDCLCRSHGRPPLPGARGAIEVKDFADYQAKLRAAKVLLDPAERRDVILTEAGRLTAGEGRKTEPQGRPSALSPRSPAWWSGRWCLPGRSTGPSWTCRPKC